MKVLMESFDEKVFKEILLFQIAALQSISLEKHEKMEEILRKKRSGTKFKRSVSINDQIIEYPIGSDYDPKILRKIKKDEI